MDEASDIRLMKEVRDMRQMVALSLLKQPSPSDRLLGVSWTSRLEQPDDSTLEALQEALNHDRNVNVRLAAVDALYLFYDHPRVKDGLVDSLARKKAQAEKSRGMRMLQVESSGLTVEEEENVVRIDVDEGKRSVDLVIQVPFSTTLRLDSGDGDVTVERVDGEIEVDSSDGSITLNNVSGPVVADSSDGEIKAVFGKVTPGKPMSFSTMDGDIDITLPSDVKASLKLKSEEGRVFTDFDIRLTPSQQKKEQDERKKGGGYRVSFEKVSLGLINGGGVEIQLTTYEGDIFIRKAK